MLFAFSRRRTSVPRARAPLAAPLAAVVLAAAAAPLVLPLAGCVSADRAEFLEARDAAAAARVVPEQAVGEARRATLGADAWVVKAELVREQGAWWWEVTSVRDAGVASVRVDAAGARPTPAPVEPALDDEEAAALLAVRERVTVTLERAAEAARAQHLAAKVTEVELEIGDDGVPVWEVELMIAGSELVDVTVDAATGAVID